MDLTDAQHLYIQNSYIEINKLGNKSKNLDRYSFTPRQDMTFCATIIAEITMSQYIFLDNCHTEFYPHRTKKKTVELFDARKSSMSFTILIFIKLRNAQRYCM